jgi:hypothetical protein
MNGITARTTALAAYPIFGGTQPQYGITVRGDVLVNQTGDGVDLNHVWDEFADLLNVWNNERTRVTDLLSFQTTASGEAVPQNVAIASFEEATELGVPKAAGMPGDSLPLGYTFKDMDLAGRFSWKFLRDADRRQVDAVMNGILSADNKLVTGTLLRRLFDPTEKRNEFGHRVFGLWNGTDGLVPPPYLGRTFDTSTTHYIAGQAPQIDSADIEDAIRLITRKGYGTAPNSKILILANPDEGENIMAWRAGEPSRASGPDARYDFIPATDQPPFITPQGELIGDQVPGQIWDVDVQGSYGPALLVQSDFVPSGYVAVVASSGPNSPSNCIGYRQHPNSAYQGLRMIPGAGQYPLVGAYHQRSFGVGVRQRGAAVCIQVTNDTDYSAPTADQIPV